MGKKRDEVQIACGQVVGPKYGIIIGASNGGNQLVFKTDRALAFLRFVRAEVVDERK